MKKLNTFLLLMIVSLISLSCSDDDDITSPIPSGNTTIYDLQTKDVAGISGTATFVENTDASVTIRLDITGTPAGGLHPAHIHFNTAAEGGDIALPLEPVNGDSGQSEITVSALDDGSSITYDELLDFDGYINVHLSASEIETIVAQGDIGQNDLTGESKAYTLAEKDVPSISGTATFYKRVNGTALAVLDIQNTPEGGSHPAHIHNNDAATGGGIAFTFNSVDGDSGLSSSQVETLDDETAIGYNDILTFNGYINVHLSIPEITTIVAQGNIGSNE